MCGRICESHIADDHYLSTDFAIAIVFVILMQNLLGPIVKWYNAAFALQRRGFDSP